MGGDMENFDAILAANITIASAISLLLVALKRCFPKLPIKIGRTEFEGIVIPIVFAIAITLLAGSVIQLIDLLTQPEVTSFRAGFRRFS